METYITATRHHDFDAGHRVYQHQGQCHRIHGHGYRAYFTCRAPALNELGMVIDFGLMKTRLCKWIDDNWDHRFLLWQDDPLVPVFKQCGPESLVLLPHLPTAENMASYLLNVIGPQQLKGTAVQLVEVIVEETRKCSAKATLL